MQGLPECGMAKFLLILASQVLPGQEYPPPPPPPPQEMRSWPDLGTLSFDLARIPPQLEIRQILALWVLTRQEYPSPTVNWKLGRSWHFEFWLDKNTSPPSNLSFDLQGSVLKTNSSFLTCFWECKRRVWYSFYILRRLGLIASWRFNISLSWPLTSSFTFKLIS